MSDPSPQKWNNFSYSRKDETGVYSRTPLGLIALFLGVLRERFSVAIAGQNTGFVWTPPPPGLANPLDYKNTTIYIEKWGSEFSKVENFCPAITLKRAALQFNSLVYADMARLDPKTMATLNIGQITSGMLINTYARNEAECDILGNIVYELFVRGRWIFQRTFEINICRPDLLTETQVIPELAQLDNKIYQCSIQLSLNYDFNHMYVPIAPKLKEIELFLKSDAQQTQEYLGSTLIF